MDRLRWLDGETARHGKRPTHGLVLSCAEDHRAFSVEVELECFVSEAGGRKKKSPKKINSQHLHDPWLCQVFEQLSGVKSPRHSYCPALILSLMTLLNIPFILFPSLHSSPSASSSRVSTSFPNRTRSWCNSLSAPARRSEPGRMSDSAPNTGYMSPSSSTYPTTRIPRAHTDRHPRQPPRLRVPRRRPHDPHQSRRFTAF